MKRDRASYTEAELLREARRAPLPHHEQIMHAHMSVDPLDIALAYECGCEWDAANERGQDAL